MPRKANTEAIKTFLDDLWAQAQGMLSKGRVQTEKVAQSARVKMDLYLLTTKKQDLYQKLGEAFYASTKRKKVSSSKQEAVLAIVQEIKEIELHAKELQKGFKPRPAPRAAKPRTAPRAAKPRTAPRAAKPRRRGRPKKKATEAAPSQ